jgi:cytochrome b involved in lipid metabolism
MSRCPALTSPTSPTPSCYRHCNTSNKCTNQYLARYVFPILLIIGLILISIIAYKSATTTKIHPFGIIGIAVGFAAVKLAEWQKTLSHQEYTLQEISQHCTSQSCWILVDGNVYDVTDFLPKHPPGAQKILAYAGKDASKQYAFHLESTKHFWRQLKIGWLKMETV